MAEDLFQDDLFQDDDDIQLSSQDTNLIVYSRDWTIQTIIDQIEQGNIELNPGFQRRNAWNDNKRSKLIESILIGYPVPEIVLAEDKHRKKSFIVIDGKQRLLTIAGYVNNDKYKYWEAKTPLIKGDSRFCGKSYSDISSNPEIRRIFENSSLRCTVISNYSSDDELYDIFYRLNAASTPLATQELRQALYRGEFSNYLIRMTDEDNPIRKVMKLSEADKRLRDVEILLRLISFIHSAKKYKGNLLKFLDSTMSDFNKEWSEKENSIEESTKQIYDAILLLKDIFGDFDKVGRKYKGGQIEQRFNRVLLEVEVFYFRHLIGHELQSDANAHFIESFMNLCDSDSQFMSSLEGSTKNIENYRVRYSKFYEIFTESYPVVGQIDNPFPISDGRE